MKTFKGKAIYNPIGKAGEYANWACNFYVGCSNGCDYCYLKKGRGAKVLGGDVPVLKKCFRDEEHALEVFGKEMFINKDSLKEHGLFFTFSSDPFLPETLELNTKAILTAIINEIPVKVLTKRADFFGKFTSLLREHGIIMRDMKYLAFGFTLTGCDDREPNASSTIERIRAITSLRNAGFKTWASIEPVIDIYNSLAVINLSKDSCDLYKIGLLSGMEYNVHKLCGFIDAVIRSTESMGCKVYFKDSLLQKVGITRESLPANCVGRDYNIFSNK